MWRRGLCDLLAAQPDLTVAAEAEDVPSTLQALRSSDLVCLDAEVALDAEVGRVRREVGVPVLVLAYHLDPARADRLIQSGASGLLTKDTSPDLLLEAIRAVARGESRWYATPSAPDASTVTLSDREREVLLLLAGGRSNGEIADALTIAENTVRNHLANAYAKISVTTAREAMAWAWRTRFVR